MKSQLWLSDITIANDGDINTLIAEAVQDQGYTGVEVLWHSAPLAWEDGTMLHEVEVLVNHPDSLAHRLSFYTVRGRAGGQPEPSPARL